MSELRLNEEVLNRLPQEAGVWIRRLNGEQRNALETILHYTEVENFERHWKHHRKELERVEAAYGKFGRLWG
jgi:hypothetical protein